MIPRPSRGCAELSFEGACELLGVSHLELLGYRDSGMTDWDYHSRPDAFCNVPIEESAGRLVTLFEKYRPDVVVTYADDSGYEHPDHVQATRVTMAAVERSDMPKKTYWSVIRASSFARFREYLIEQGADLDLPEPDTEFVRKMRELEERITTTIDVRPVVERKRAALRLHASQIEESFFAKLPDNMFRVIFAEEDFIRVRDETSAPVPEHDLFAGLRR